MQHQRDLARYLYLTPELEAYSNVRDVEDAIAFPDLPPAPPAFDANLPADPRIYISAQPYGVSPLNRVIRDAMVSTGRLDSNARAGGEFVGHIRCLVMAVAGSDGTFVATNIASVDVLAGDHVRLFPNVHDPPVDARVAAVLNATTFRVEALGSPRPIAPPEGAVWMLHGVRVWDAQRQAMVARSRTPRNDVMAPAVDARPPEQFDVDLYRSLYADASALQAHDAYIDYRLRWQRSQRRAGQGDDVGSGGGGGGGGVGACNAFVWDTSSNLVVTATNLGIRSGFTGAASNLIVEPGQATLRSGLVAASSNVVVTSGDVAIRSGFTAADSNVVVTPGGVAIQSGFVAAGGNVSAMPTSVVIGSSFAAASNALVVTSNDLRYGTDRLVVRPDGGVEVAGGLAVALGSNFAVRDRLLVGGASASNDAAVAVDGDVWVSGTVISLSDARAKTGVRTIEGALDRVAMLRGVTYAPAADKTRRRHTGLLAQDVLAAMPEAVYDSGDGRHSVAYGNLAGLLVEAINELRARIP